MSASQIRQPALKLGLTFIIILALNIQPNWLPLLEDVRLASETGSLTAKSRAAIDDAYARQPWNSGWATSAGLAALAAGDYPAAQTAIRAAATTGQWTPELHSALGDALAGSKDLDGAIGEWEAALPQRLNDPVLLSKLATAYEIQGRYPQAAANLRALVALQPNNAKVQYRFGLVLSVIDPASAPSHLALAAGLDSTLQPDAENLNKAVEAGLQANDKAILFGTVGHMLIFLGEYPLAKVALTHAVTERPDFAQAYAYLGLAEDQLGDDGSASYQKALAIDANLPVAHYLLGLHYRRKGDNDQAIATLKKAFELDPSNAAAAAELGSAYTELADLTSAEQWYRQAVQVAPTDASFWLLLAKFYVNHDLRLDTDGLLSAQKATELDPTSAEAFDTLGFAQQLKGDNANSEASLQKAISLDAKLASAQFHLGLLYLDTGRTTEAKPLLEQAVRLDAGGPIAEQALKALARLGLPLPSTPTP